ncbi:ECF RNA polymerase sigma factor SigE [Aquisphaera giovannonii]|uniref:ECF RNA polymerase sigma factor SigE n=1 Tax=Aquisphaera giovannonii TaxID=406548 RepID=A0A5B9VV87_9BACT|nr:sigma-70 family RNA polymerase sigma factor [Aquisphaera giovannonii]QEH31974.1 ECF RNA polymerase sigma factor SigE [Aquisphaera giovannonii]
MAMESPAIAPGPLDRIFAHGVLTGLPDDRLLDRFLADRDGDAFAALVARHGPMVLRVGLATLANASDAEDVFQATFLILVRRARSLRGRPDLGGWLFRVAHRVCLRANAVAARRRAKEQAAARMTAMTSSNDPAPPDDLAPSLHEAIARLPESLRSAILLCDLREIPQRDAALALKTSERTLRRRLARARDRLKDRLTHQGLAFEAALLAFRSRDAATVVPPSWSDAVIRAALGQAAATASARALAGSAIDDGVSRMVTFAAVGLAAVALVAWAGVTALPARWARASEATGGIAEQHGLETAPITVTGKATDEQGRPVVGATVYLASTRGISINGIDAPLGAATTGVDGSYRFDNARLPIVKERDAPPWGTFQVYGTAPGHGFAWHEAWQYYPRRRPAERNTLAITNVSFDGKPVVMDLRFPRRSFLAGRIVDESRRPIPGAEVRLRQCDHLDISGRATNVNIRQFASISLAPASMTTTRTDEEGRFRIDGLPVECGFWVHVKHPDHALQTLFAATTEQSPTSFNYPRDSVHTWIDPPPAQTGPLLIVLDAVRRVAVRTVLAETRQPASGVGVSASRGAYAIQASGTSDADGRLELRLPPGQYDLYATATADGSDCVRTGGTLRVAAEPAELPFEFPVRSGSIVNFEVVDAETRQGVPGVSLRCIEGCDINRGRVQSRTGTVDDPVTDARGRLRAALCPGEQTFSILQLPPSSPYQPVGQPKSVTLRPGDTVTVRFELRRVGP